MLGLGHLLGLVFHLIIGDDTPSLNSTSNASLFRKPKDSNQTPQPNRYRKTVQSLCTAIVWCIFQHAPYSLKYIGFPTGYMEGRIKPWWDVYICLLPKVYKTLYTNKLYNKCIFSETIPWMIILSQDHGPSPHNRDRWECFTNPGEMCYWLIFIKHSWLLGNVRHQRRYVYSLL